MASGGHGVITTQGATRNAERLARIPDWCLNDTEVSNLIKSKFPKADKNPYQYKRAKLWAGVIYLYWRVGRTRGQVAADLQVSSLKVRNILRDIKHWRLGMRADGRGLLKKKHDTIHASVGNNRSF